MSDLHQAFQSVCYAEFTIQLLHCGNKLKFYVPSILPLREALFDLKRDTPDDMDHIKPHLEKCQKLLQDANQEWNQAFKSHDFNHEVNHDIREAGPYAKKVLEKFEKTLAKLSQAVEDFEHSAENRTENRP